MKQLEAELEASQRRILALIDDLEEARAPFVADQGARGAGQDGMRQRGMCCLLLPPLEATPLQLMDRVQQLKL